MRNIFLMTFNTLKVTFRKKGNFIVYLVLPAFGVLFSMLIYGNSGSGSVTIGVLDRDASTLSTDLRNAVGGWGNFNVADIEEDGIKAGLLDGKVDSVLVIPAGYADGFFNGRMGKVELVSVKGRETTAWIENFVNQHSKSITDLVMAAGGDRAEFERLYAGYRSNGLKMYTVELEDQRTSKNVTVFSLGFLIMFVMLGAGLTSQLILNEKKNRTYFRICCAPVRPRDYIAANFFTSLAIVMAQIIVLQLLLKYLFHIETFVPDPILFLILVCFGIAAIGLSLMITAFSDSSYMAGTLSSLIVTPTCMIGGCFWPAEFMPEIMQKIAFFMPQHWALDGVQKMQLGAALGDIGMHLAILLAFAAAFLLVAVYRFSKTGNVQKFV